MAEESSSANGTKSISKDMIEAVNLLAHGKRNILCGEISQAVTQLQEACRILGAEFGELADECADAYLWYGKALLELSRMENGVLGDAITGAESEESDSSEEDSSDDQNSTKEENATEEDEQEDGVMSEDLEEEEVSEAKDQGSTATDTDCNLNGTKKTDETKASNTKEIKTTHQTETDTSTQEKQGKEENAVSDSGHPSTSEDGEKSTEVAGPSKPEENDDVSNLQLAWEMLELSKIIYQRHDHNDMKLKLAEAHLRLGEIGMETEQYDQAINDLTQCLQIQQQILEPEDRRLAETMYQLGLACTYCRHYDSAVAHYRSAMDVIQVKISRLSKIVSGEIPPDPIENSDGFYTPLELAEKEIEELRELLPDISAKIDDVRDEQGEAEKVKILMKETVAPSTGISSSSTSSQIPNKSFDGPSTSAYEVHLPASAQPVNNISHLVRKKRKSEDITQPHTECSKRQKATTDVTDGVSPNNKDKPSPGDTSCPLSAPESGDSISVPNDQKSQHLNQSDF